MDHTAYLLRLAELELLERERRTVERRIREARFPAVKSLDSFDFAAIPSLNKMLVLELARGEYVERRENVIALGPSGTGKTHVALGLGLAACQQGLAVGFVTAAALVHELLEARDERRLLRLHAAAGGLQAADRGRARLRAAVAERGGAAVRGVQPALRAGLDPGHQQPAVRRVDERVRLRRTCHDASFVDRLVRRTWAANGAICPSGSVICQGWPLASWRPVSRPRRSHLNTVWHVTPSAAAAPCTE